MDLVSPPIPMAGLLPGCVTSSALFSLLRALPRPRAGDPEDLGRGIIHDALTVLRAFRLRDGYEVMLAIRLVIAEFAARGSVRLSHVCPEGSQAQRQNDQISLRQFAVAAQAEQRLLRHRRALVKEGVAPEELPAWEYDLRALEAVWRKGGEAVVDAAPVEMERQEAVTPNAAAAMPTLAPSARDAPKPAARIEPAPAEALVPADDVTEGDPMACPRASDEDGPSQEVQSDGEEDEPSRWMLGPWRNQPATPRGAGMSIREQPERTAEATRAG